MLLESQYHQFKSDLNVQKPKGSIAFITDIDRKELLAIGHHDMSKYATNNAGSTSKNINGAGDKKQA